MTDLVGDRADPKRTVPVESHDEHEDDLSVTVRHRRLERRRHADYVSRPEARM